MTSSAYRTVIKMLNEGGITLSTAESCTGGQIAAAITAIPGASTVFQGGVVAYQNHVKTSLLSVPAGIIDKYDVVSEEVATLMVKGACRLFPSDLAIASTGYAGPSGGSAKVPLGTIWLACGNQEKVLTRKLECGTDRGYNIEYATKEAVSMLIEFISSNKSEH